MLRHDSRNHVALALLMLLAGCNASPAQDEPLPAQSETASSDDLGLFSTLPIYWGEGADISSMIGGGGEQGWVRGTLEQEGDLVPLDTLEPEALQGLDRVVLAQPRPLAPSENVAFDGWLRGGGKALIFADPMLTQHSDYALGDPRRPHDMVVISPLLSHWGLRLVFDEDQPEGLRPVTDDGFALPVDLAGRFEPVQGDEGARCTISPEGLMADCRIGKGRTLLVADAALLDDHFPEASRSIALSALLARVFAN